MTAETLSGTVRRPGFDERDRVLAVEDDRSILGETPIDRTGSWSMDVDQTPDLLVVQLTGSRVAVVATDPSRADLVDTPRLVRVQFVQNEPPPNVIFWVDPMDLEGFPRHLLWTLRAHRAGILDLHVGEYPVTGRPIELEVQPGVYRISGGRVAVHPGEDAVSVSWAIDESTGERFDATGESVVLGIHDDAVFQISYTSGPGAEV